MVAVSSAALGVEMVLPQSTVAIGAAPEPMPIAIHGAAGVQGVELAIAYDPSVVRLSADPQQTAMSANCMVMVNAAVPGQMRLALACPNAVQGSGLLLTLSLYATGAGTTPLALQRCDVNEGTVACTTRDGLVTVNGVAPRVSAPARFLRVHSNESTTVDRLTFRGGFLLPSATSFATLDPQSNGAQLVVAEHTGTVKVSIELPGGAYGGRGTRGWSRRSGGWLYLDQTEAPIDGITRMAIWDGARREPGLVLVRMNGKGGSYPVDAADLPLRVAVDLGASQVESAFASSSCTATGDGRKRQCRE